MAYRIAGIDVHKKMVVVAIADVEVGGTWRFDRRQMRTRPAQRRALAEWLVACEVDEVVMESTAQHWRPVWEALERDWQRRRDRADLRDGVGQADCAEQCVATVGVPRVRSTA